MKKEEGKRQRPEARSRGGKLILVWINACRDSEVITYINTKDSNKLALPRGTCSAKKSIPPLRLASNTSGIIRLVPRIALPEAKL